MIPANIILIAWYIFIEKNWKLSIKIPAIAISSLLLMISLKLLFARPRPINPIVLAAGYSFPSGHALMSVTFYGLMAFISFQKFKNKWVQIVIGSFFLMLIFLIALSRIYLRVHYASDVIAGLCVGFIWLVLSLLILRRIENKWMISADYFYPRAQ